MPAVKWDFLGLISPPRERIFGARVRINRRSCRSTRRRSPASSPRPCGSRDLGLLAWFLVGVGLLLVGLTWLLGLTVDDHVPVASRRHPGDRRRTARDEAAAPRHPASRGAAHRAARTARARSPHHADGVRRDLRAIRRDQGLGSRGRRQDRGLGERRRSRRDLRHHATTSRAARRRPERRCCKGSWAASRSSRRSSSS